MKETKTISVIPCVSPNPKAQRAAEELPRIIKDSSRDTIRIRSGAVYQDSHTKIPLVCLTCNNEWKVKPNSLKQAKTGCPKCAIEKKKGVTGVLRRRQSTPDEKQIAQKLYEECGNYTEVGRRLGRDRQTIMRWLDKGYYQRQLNLSREKDDRDRKSGHSKVRRKNYNSTPNGKANRRKARHKRRGLEFHARDVVLLPNHPDADYQGFVLYDVYEDGYITTEEDRELWGFSGADEDVARRSVQQDKLSKISGEPYSLEHLIPLSRGGVHSPENFANRALELNTKKNNSLWDEDTKLFCRRLFSIG